MESYSMRQGKEKKAKILAQQEQTRTQTAAVVQVVQSLRLKDQWQSKISDTVIRARYRQEAIDQGVSDATIDKALSILDILAQCNGFKTICDLESGGTSDNIVVKILVGDKEFSTDTDTLTADKDSMLHRMFSPPWFTPPEDPTKAIPLHTATNLSSIFEHILAYLQALKDGSSELCSSSELTLAEHNLLLEDCDYLGIQRLPVATRLRMFDHDVRTVEKQKTAAKELKGAKEHLASLREEKASLEARLAELPGLISTAEKALEESQLARGIAKCSRPAQIGDEIKIYADGYWRLCTVEADSSKIGAVETETDNDATEETVGGAEEEKGLVAMERSDYRRSSTKHPLPPPTDYFHTNSELSTWSGCVVVADSFLPPQLAESLEGQLDALLTEKPLDIHPGSNSQVIDLIHPSLYPYIEGVSPVSSQEALSECARVEDKYAWLPAEFDVDAHRNVSISSYINNLDRKHWPDLYTDLSFAFSAMLPMYEKVLKKDLTSRKLQVIVKAAYYLIPPGESYSGSWHIEGMEHEHIAASGIYYLNVSDNIENNKLCFRSQLSEEDFYDENGRAGEEMVLIEDHGCVDTPAQRGLVWSNDIQHKVGNLSVYSMEQTSKRIAKKKNSWMTYERQEGARLEEEVSKKTASDYKAGMRKILCFFLVDPEVRVVSTEIVPPQQDAGVLTLEEAMEHRQSLMNARKYHAESVTEAWEERTYTFCEH